MWLICPFVSRRLRNPSLPTELICLICRAICQPTNKDSIVGNGGEPANKDSIVAQSSTEVSRQIRNPSLPAEVGRQIRVATAIPPCDPIVAATGFEPALRTHPCRSRILDVHTPGIAGAGGGRAAGGGACPRRHGQGWRCIVAPAQYVTRVSMLTPESVVATSALGQNASSCTLP